LPLKPSYLMLTGAGAIVAVAGVKGWGVGATLRDIISGKSPAKNPVLANTITGASYPAAAASAFGYGAAAGALAGAAGGLSGIAESLIGFPYKWDGSPATGVADCSSLMNWCVGHLGGRAIPGYKAGTYDGTEHGPNTVLWLAWFGTGLSRVSRANAQPGDLAIWQTHMGMITGTDQMVSDLNPSLGTRQTTIAEAAPPGEILFVGRLK
jgi:cell wall-associated NlpC family hydrolase